MSDDIDERIRAAMKVLDDEAPSGYFEALPNVTLSRLGDDIEMQTVNRMTDDSSTGIPPQADAARDEDSGLHDIRSLASSTKLRMSKKMPAVQPVDDDILASSSAGWKAMALPEPAKMISLPELAHLPDASEVKAKDKATRKAEAKQAKTDIAAAPVAATAAAEVSTAPMIGARFAQQPKSKTGLYAAVGIALAAAAGVGIYLKVSAKSDAPAVVASAEQPTATPIEAPAEKKAELAAATPPPPPVQPAPVQAAVVPADVATTPAAASGMVVAQEESDGDDKRAAKARGEKKDTRAAGQATDTVAAKPDKAEKPVAPAAPAGGAGAGEEDPSFDALLKEAGVEKTKNNGPKLDKKSLSSSDIKTAMNGVADKAKGCYSGTEGSATVKLTVAPDGKVSKVKVSGVFAGTPTGACIESAVRGADFPAWDGGPQSVSYSYLLAE